MSGSNATKEKTLGPGVTVYEGARRFRPGSPESVWPERFKDSKVADMPSKDHSTLRDKMVKGKPAKDKEATPEPPKASAPAGAGSSAPGASG